MKMLKFSSQPTVHSKVTVEKLVLHLVPKDHLIVVRALALVFLVELPVLITNNFSPQVTLLHISHINFESTVTKT
jgi:hypothetical protein